MSYAFGSESIWNRRGEDTLTDRQYLVAYFGSIFYGLLLTALVGKWAVDHAILEASMELIGKWGPLVLMGIVLLLSIGGIMIAQSSDDPKVSILGHSILAGSFGLILGPFTAAFSADLVIKAMLITAMVVFVLTVVGIIYPNLLRGFGIYLFGALTVLVIGQFGLLGMAAFGVQLSETTLNLIDWAAVVIFSGYLIYDTGRAMTVPRTLDNAIDCSMATYLDIINLFIRILEIYARSQRK
jgi:FtsH-binding integral membrane protein